MKKLISVLLLLFLSLVINLEQTEAYVLNNQYTPMTATYRNLSSGTAYTHNLNRATAWNYSGAKVFVTQADIGYINFYQGVVNTDNGTYGICFYNNSSQSDIRYYRAWITAGSLIRNEVVVHEVGHAIGLSHTQTANNLNAVMRATGFNNKAYPLSDDKAGMNAKY